MSPVIILDELDKVGEDTKDSHIGPLYGLLERVSARRFVDGAIGLPVDASFITWFATCNDPSLIEPALRSRFRIVTVPSPTRAQMRQVVRSIQRSLAADVDWVQNFDTELPEKVIDALCELTPRQVGRALEDAYATAAMADRTTLRADDVLTIRTLTKQPIGFTN